jgi:protein-disulfide isomerase
LFEIPAPCRGVGVFAGPAARGAADDTEITFDMVVNDPDAPTAGNPNGNLTFMDFFDYDCPYCEMSATNLERLLRRMETSGLLMKIVQF